MSRKNLTEVVNWFILLINLAYRRLIMAVKKENNEETPKVVKGKTKYSANSIYLYHPFQKVAMHVDVPVDLEVDGWLTSQIEVGLVSKVSC